MTPLGSDLKNLIEIGKKKFNMAFSVVEELFDMLAPRNKTIVIFFFLQVSYSLGTGSVLIYCSVF